MKSSRRLPAIRSAAAAAVATLLAVSGAHAQSTNGSISWAGWTFTYNVNNNSEGLVLSGVKFNNRSLLRKISLPVMKVFYNQSACGPYADRIDQYSLTPVTWANNATVVLREFTLNGRQWGEIGVRAQIGNYDIYQAYYLSTDGTLDAHIYSRGLQCQQDHVHWPNWRIDVDLDGAANNVIEKMGAVSYQPLTNEFDQPATSAVNHQWRVRNTVTGMWMDVLPGFADFTIADGNRNVPVTAYDRNSVFGRLYKAGEDIGWTVGPNTPVQNNNGEALAADPVLWYEGYMPHAAADGQNLWHSTGVRLVAHLEGAPVLPPTATGNLIVTAKATLLGGIGADMELFINGRSLGITTVNALAEQDYGFDVPALAVGDKVDVVFRNDAYDPVNGVDRNLIVQRVIVNNRATILPNAEGVTYDKGWGAEAFDGVNVVPGQSGLWENGALRMTVPAGAAVPVTPPVQSQVQDTESNDTRATAQLVALPGTANGAISSGDKDYYAVTVPPGATLKVTMTGTGDMDMALESETGSVLTTGASSSGADESMTWRNAGSAAQKVYVRVYGYQTQSGTYQVSFN